VYTQTRGLRNNNPGNIRKTNDQWQGLKQDQSGDLAFFQFIAPEYGIRAMTKLLRNYQKNYGLNTVQDIIARWAPPVENDTGPYVRNVANAVGVAPEDRIDTNDFDTVTAMVNAIIKHENGLNPYSNATIKKGVALGMA